ncbi:MAG: DUF2306 domain-containing protein [Rhodocyclaceae bacterium]|nr:DUF2306 domain-containing protein [Rhodocyclaceae bacterium]
MTYLNLVYLHLATVLPAFLIGTWLMLNHKGTSLHRLLGKAYMLLMLTTAIVALFIPAVLGPRWLNHFGFIHLFCVLTIYTVPTAYLAARRHDVAAHLSGMIWLYVGGLVIAGSFAFSPGRLLHKWLFA